MITRKECAWILLVIKLLFKILVNKINNLEEEKKSIEEDNQELIINFDFLKIDKEEFTKVIENFNNK